MKRSKIFTVGLIALVGIMLVACSKQNPLQTKDQKTTVAFLAKTAKSASARLKLSSLPNGMVYRACMNGANMNNKCNQLYQEMLKIAHKTSGYENLTLAELTSKIFWAKIKDDYTAVAFNQI